MVRPRYVNSAVCAYRDATDAGSPEKALAEGLDLGFLWQVFGILRRIRRARYFEAPDVLKNVADSNDLGAQGVDTPLLGFMRDVGFDAAERARHVGYDLVRRSYPGRCKNRSGFRLATRASAAAHRLTA